jgi:hypothetical protein
MNTNGFKCVALKAILDFDYKKAVKLWCDKHNLNFKIVWAMEKNKKLYKVEAIKNGSWKSRLSSVSYVNDPVPTLRQKKRSFWKGRCKIMRNF